MGFNVSLSPYHKDFVKISKYIARIYGVDWEDLLSQAYVVYLELVEKGKADESRAYVLTAVKRNLREYSSRNLLGHKDVKVYDPNVLKGMGWLTTLPNETKELEFKELVRLAELSHEDLQILYLHAEGYAIKEIAELLGYSAPNISVKLKTIKEKLREANEFLS